MDKGIVRDALGNRALCWRQSSATRSRTSSGVVEQRHLLVLGAMFLPLGLDEVGLNSGSVSPPDMVGGEGPEGGGVCEGKTGTL